MYTANTCWHVRLPKQQSLRIPPCMLAGACSSSPTSVAFHGPCTHTKPPCRSLACAMPYSVQPQPQILHQDSNWTGCMLACPPSHSPNLTPDAAAASIQLPRSTFHKIPPLWLRAVCMIIRLVADATVVSMAAALIIDHDCRCHRIVMGPLQLEGTPWLLAIISS